MKKFLTFLALVCFMVTGAWAQTTVELTTDVNNPHLYQIASYNRGGVLTSNGAGQGVTHVDMGNGGYWYFTAAEGNTTGTVAGGVIMHNMDGTQLKNNWTTAATGDVIYILPNGVNDNGISICKNSAIQGSDCMDANNYNTGVGTWGPSTSDWEGTTWVISATEMNLDTYRANAKTTIDGYYLASESLKTTHKGNVDEATIPAAVDAAVTAAFAAYQTEVAGKVWHVQSGYPEYYNKQGVYKSLKYNGTTIGWGNFSNEDTQCYMYLEITTGGKLYVKTTDGKYMQGVDGSLGATPGTNSAATLKKYDDGTFNMIFGNGTAHTNNHGNGSGVSGNLVNWDGEGGSASSWKFIEGDAEKLASLLFGEALKNAINEAADAYAVNDVPTTATDIDADLITEGSQFYSPYTTADSQKVDGVDATDEQVYAFLLDKDVNTYWHSQWNAGNQPAHKHYLQVTLTEPISGSVLLTMNRRKTNADQITKMSVEYSTDGNTYTQLPGHMTFPTGTNGEQIQGTFHLPTNASYLRFYEDETTNNRGYWHCSEFQLNKVTNSRNIEHTTEAAALQSAIATATAAFNSGSYTQATIDALLAAIETYKNAVDAAPATITYEYKIGDEIVDTEVIESVVGAEYPAPKTFEFYTQSAKPTGTISESGTYTINLTWDGPFEFTTINGSDFAEGTKWYYMQNGNNNGNGYVVYGNGEDKRSSMTTTAGTDDTYKWCFVRKTGSTAFYLYNKAADAIALHEELSSDAQHPEWATNHNQGFCVAKTEGVNDMPLILVANGTAGYTLKLADAPGTCILGKHVTENNIGYLSIWGNSANVNDNGSRFTFEEADVTIEYTVSITGNPSEAKVFYNNDEGHTTGSTIEAADLKVSELSATTIDGYSYTITIDAANSTIKVAYMKALLAGHFYTIKAYNTNKYICPSSNWATTGAEKVAYTTAPTMENGGVWELCATNVEIPTFCISPAKTKGDTERGYLNPWNGSSNTEGAVGCWKTCNGNDRWTLTPVEGLDNVYTVQNFDDKTIFFYNKTGVNLLYYNKPGPPSESNYFVIEEYVDNKTYTVHISGNTSDAKLTYNSNEYANGDTFEASALQESELSATEIAGLDYTIAISGTDVNVTYVPALIDVTKTYYILSADAPTNMYVYMGSSTGNVALSTTDKTAIQFEKVSAGVYAIKGDGKYVGVSSWNAVPATSSFGWTVAKTEDDVFTFSQNTGSYTSFLGTDAAKLLETEAKLYNNKGATDPHSFILVEVGTANWAGLEAAINSAYEYPVGDGLGEFSWMVMDVAQNDFWEPTLEYYSDILSEKTATADEVDEYIGNVQEMVAALQINQPKPGTFLRVIGANSLNFIAGDNSVSNGHAAMTDAYDATSILCYTEDGELIGYKSGLGFTGTYSRASVGGTFEHHTFSASPYGEKGAYTIQSDYSGSKVLYDGGTDVNRNSAANSVNCAWYLEEITELPVEFKEAGKDENDKYYSTLYSPVAVELHPDVTAYYATSDESSFLSVEPLESDVVPANTPVILEADEAGTKAFPLATENEDDPLTGNLLHGTVYTKESTSSQDYVLSVVDGKVGFYKYVGSSLQGFKAYFNPTENGSASSEIQGFTLDFGGQTVGVSSVISATNLKAGYDIQGRRINKVQKGINILNGKKIIK